MKIRTRSHEDITPLQVRMQWSELNKTESRACCFALLIPPVPAAGPESAQLTMTMNLFIYLFPPQLFTSS